MPQPMNKDDSGTENAPPAIDSTPAEAPGEELVPVPKEDPPTQINPRIAHPRRDEKPGRLSQTFCSDPDKKPEDADSKDGA
jgi:hypothetical protein